MAEPHWKEAAMSSRAREFVKPRIRDLSQEGVGVTSVRMETEAGPVRGRKGSRRTSCGARQGGALAVGVVIALVLLACSSGDSGIGAGDTTNLASESAKPAGVAPTPTISSSEGFPIVDPKPDVFLDVETREATP